ncbi:hypothetical protein D3C86_1396230 [compost metagenome]
MEGIGSGAVEFLGDQAEILGTARFEHADDHAVFAAHAPHDLPDRVELTKLAGDIALDVLELELFRAGVEAQRPAQVVSQIDRRQRLALGLEKTVANALVPLHRIQDANRRLRLDDPLG